MGLEKPVRSCSRYQDANPVRTSSLVDHLATAPSGRWDINTWTGLGRRFNVHVQSKAVIANGFRGRWF